MNELTIRAHVQAIDDCNQRGGRMLSLVDLLDAGTVDLPLAAYLAAVMRSGASLLVGARPGAAGKTAVMGALINFVPDHTVIYPTETPAVLAAALGDTHPGDTCYLAHEVGRGHYYAYIWGREARAFFALAAKGHIIATNLHADTLEETRDQLCRENGVARIHLDAVAVKVYLRVERVRGWAVRRLINRVYESDGLRDRLLWTGREDGTSTRLEDSALVSSEQEEAYAGFLITLLRENTRRIGAVRRALLRFSDPT